MGDSEKIYIAVIQGNLSSYLPGVHLHPRRPHVVLVAVCAVDTQVHGVEDSRDEGGEEEAQDGDQGKLLQATLVERSQFCDSTNINFYHSSFLIKLLLVQPNVLMSNFDVN